MLRKRSAKRAGFTLPEVLVTVAIVAVLAAIVVPTVTSQIGKGDEANLQTSIANVRTGITAFVSDTRKFPRRISDLVNQPLAADLDLFGNAYGAGAVAKWRGPYVSGGMVATDSLDMALAYGGNTMIDSNLNAGASGQVIVSLSGVLTQLSANRLDTLIDAGNGDALGILQWQPAAGAIAERAVKLQLMGSR
jgi:type IV pilus assembly protein PilA